MPVRFHFQKVVPLEGKKKLASFIPGIMKAEDCTMGTIDFIFCSNNYLLKINRDFLNHDYFTDIITFDMSNQSSLGISGEIYISVDMVKANAKHFNVTFSEELRRVMFHGILHLCGYKDKTAREKKIMREKEDHYLKMFHVKH